MNETPNLCIFYFIEGKFRTFDSKMTLLRQNASLPSRDLAETLKQFSDDRAFENIHRTSPVGQTVDNSLMSLTHDDISSQLKSKLGANSVSSLESLKAEGGGSQSSRESLNLDDFDDENVRINFIHHFTNAALGVPSDADSFTRSVKYGQYANINGPFV